MTDADPGPTPPPRPPGARPAVTEIDARGLKCPLPIIRAARAAKAAKPGEELVVVTTDPAAEPDFQAWCRMRGHTLLSQEPLSDGGLRHRILLASWGARPAPLPTHGRTTGPSIKTGPSTAGADVRE